MTVIAEIFSQGEELVNGQIVDSNAAWISQQLLELGFTVSRHTAVGDDLAALTDLLTEIANRADCCICSGGLGPTSDDLTVAAVSQASSLPLVFDEIALQQIEQFFQRRQRAMPEINRKQAWLPSGAQRIDNSLGTAPGFQLRYLRCHFVFLPGVPAEMQAMFNAQVKPSLQQHFQLNPDQLISIKSIGIGESAIQQRLAELEIPDCVQLGFRAASDEVHTKLRFRADYPEQLKLNLIEQAAGLIGDYVYTISGLNKTDDVDLIGVIDRLMQTQQCSVSLFESFSHGLLASRCWQKNWLKQAAIDGNGLQIADDDAIEPHLSQLAANLRQNQRSDFALIQAYRQIPDSSTQQIQIVLYNSLHTDNCVRYARHTLVGSHIHTLQQQAATLTLDLLRRYLQSTCP